MTTVKKKSRYGNLYSVKTGEYLREATKDERYSYPDYWKGYRNFDFHEVAMIDGEVVSYVWSDSMPHKVCDCLGKFVRFVK